MQAQLALLKSTLLYPDQSGFILGRNAMANPRRLFLVLNAPCECSMPTAVASLDIQKKFDSPDWGFVKLVLTWSSLV